MSEFRELTDSDLEGVSAGKGLFAARATPGATKKAATVRVIPSLGSALPVAPMPRAKSSGDCPGGVCPAK